jgi:transcriptional regulator with XRE-family HTH domain
MRLKDARVAAGMTQEALAAKSGVPQETISSLERFLDRKPAVDTAQMLATALRLSVGDLWPVDSEQRGAA